VRDVAAPEPSPSVGVAPLSAQPRRSPTARPDEHAARVLRDLLRDAGFTGDPEAVWPLDGIGAMNRHWRVRVQGQDLVLREYGWPFLPPAPARARREAMVLRLLEVADVPAPRALAVSDNALLATFEPGQVLGEVMTPGAAATLDGAWGDVGRAWRRVHGIVPSGAVRATLLGGPQREVAGWYERVIDDVHRYLHAVEHNRPELEVDAARVHRLFAAARQLLEARPVRLLHGDAHLWNVLVGLEAGRWTCTAILDWECAEAGDPVWDLVAFHLLRRRDVGPTPPSFVDGYGDPGPTTVWALYELVHQLWQAIDVDAWPAALPSHRAATEYLRDLPARLEQLETQIGPSRAPTRTTQI
jgi:aminoglycoside phosphotransferase (APT) family kinase protein